MTRDLIIGLAFAVVSAVLVNWAYLQEHDATATMPTLSLKEPKKSISALVESRPWLKGLAVEASGFGAYAAAVGFAPLAVVQTVNAGGVGILAFITRRRHGSAATRREILGVVVAILGLAGLGVSLAESSTSSGTSAELIALIAWIAGSGAVAALLIALLTRRIGRGISYALAAGVLMAAGDIATKVATTDASRPWTIVPALACYGIGTSCLQIAYQHGGPVATAGIATLLTSAIPIVAAITILHEGLPAGFLGGLQVASFAAVVVGAVLLARGDMGSEPRRRPPYPMARGAASRSRRA